jgi:hypothetical protein
MTCGDGGVPRSSERIGRIKIQIEKREKRGIRKIERRTERETFQKILGGVLCVEVVGTKNLHPDSLLRSALTGLTSFLFPTYGGRRDQQEPGGLKAMRSESFVPLLGRPLS